MKSTAALVILILPFSACESVGYEPMWSLSYGDAGAIGFENGSFGRSEYEGWSAMVGGTFKAAVVLGNVERELIRGSVGSRHSPDSGHLLEDLERLRIEKVRMEAAAEASEIEVSGLRDDLSEAEDDWKRMAADAFKEWGVVGSFAILVLVLIGFVVWVRSKKTKVESETEGS